MTRNIGKACQQKVKYLIFKKVKGWKIKQQFLLFYFFTTIVIFGLVFMLIMVNIVLLGQSGGDKNTEVNEQDVANALFEIKSETTKALKTFFDTNEKQLLSIYTFFLYALKIDIGEDQRSKTLYFHNDLPINLHTLLTFDQVPASDVVTTTNSLNQQVERTFLQPTYFTRLSEIPTATQTRMQEVSRIFDILMSFYNVYSLSGATQIYIAFEDGELLVLYPGARIDSDFTPIVREWFYKAKDSPAELIITNPYQDTVTSQWIITISKAVQVDSTFLGVVAIDFAISPIHSIFRKDLANPSSIQSCLISTEGLFLSEQAFIEQDSYYPFAIYNDSMNGISFEQWSALQNETNDSRQFEITIGKAQETWIISKSFLNPEAKATSMIILAATKKSKVVLPTDKFDSEFSFSTNFYYVTNLSIFAGIILVSASVLLFFLGKVTTPLINLIAFNTLFLKSLYKKKHVLELQFEAQRLNIEDVDDLNQAYADFIDTVKEKYLVGSSDLTFDPNSFAFIEEKDLTQLKQKEKVYLFNHKFGRRALWRSMISQIDNAFVNKYDLIRERNEEKNKATE